MAVYLRVDKDNQMINTNVYIAYDGFKQLGEEIRSFQNVKDIKDNTESDVIVGGIHDVRYVLDKLGKPYPTLEYPISIRKYLGRNIWVDTLGSIMTDNNKRGIFIKPVEGGKLFTGLVINTEADFRGCIGAKPDTEVFCSDVVNFVSEYRCFIRYGEVVDIRHYRGDRLTVPSKEILENIVKDYEDAPNSYTIDLGVTDSGKTLLVEVNEGYSVGAYGLESTAYAKVLATRWAQLTGTEDQYKW